MASVKKENTKANSLDPNKFNRLKQFLFGTRKRIIISIIVFLIIVFLGWRIFTQGGNKPQYQTAQATRGTIISTVTENGNIATNGQGGIGSPTTGVVEEIYVKNGDTVTAGQNLFKVKSTATAQEIASTYATYSSAVASLNSAKQNQITAQAQLEKDRAAIISASSAVTTMQNNVAASQPNPATKMSYTQNDIDAINSALTSAQETFNSDQLKYTQENQDIAAAAAAVNSAWLAYQATQDSVVTAPLAGTVANVSVQPGDQVTASGGSLTPSSSTSNGTVILSIGHFSQPVIKVSASEVDIPSIKPLEKATITLNAFPNKTFVGNVANVDTVGTITSGVVTYNVYVNFVIVPNGIKPGMSATVVIQTGRRDNVLEVPTGAVQALGGQTIVRVLQNGQIANVPVTTGIASDTQTEITSGLSEGQTVITGIQMPQGASGSSSPFNATRGFGGGAFFRGGGGRGG